MRLRFTPLALVIAASLAGPLARSRAEDAPPPVTAETIRPEDEAKLRWGPASNGLRAAIVLRPPAPAPKDGALTDVFLMIQNVSDAPIRFQNTVEDPGHRELRFKVDGDLKAIIAMKEPTMADIVLKPREVAQVLVFPPGPKHTDGRTVGSFVAQDLLTDPHETIVVTTRIAKAPPGAWTGHLETPDTGGPGSPAPRRNPPTAAPPPAPASSRR